MVPRFTGWDEAVRYLFTVQPAGAQRRLVVRTELPELREVVALEDWERFLATADPATTLPQVGPRDGAQIQNTSGTTGFPKSVLLAPPGRGQQWPTDVHRLDAGAGDVIVWPLPLFHTGGCVSRSASCRSRA